jgi:hypothetical protein
MNTVLFLTLRVFHVLLAASWLGATVFMSLILMPAINSAGSAGDQITVGLGRKGITPFFGALGGLTVVTGIYLFWHFTGGFDPEISGSHAGIAYSIGGAAGLLAVILGGSVIGRSSKRVVAVIEQVATLPDGTQKSALLQEAAGLRQRMSSFGMIVLTLQVIALALMAVAHYI